MKVQELKKGTADIERGKVVMVVTGKESELDQFEGFTSYTSTKCRDESTKEDYYEDFYIVNRSDVESFKTEFKNFKKSIK